MKSLKYGALVLVAALSLSLGAFAKDKNEAKFTLNDTAQIGSTQLHPGEYKATWEGNANDVQVKIFQGKNVVANTSAKLVDKHDSQDAVTMKGDNGAKTVDEIDFGHLHKGLVFGSATTAQK